MPRPLAAAFYENSRFPAYSYDKLVLGLIDSHRYVGDPEAFAILEETTKTALPHLPGKAIEHGQSWRPGHEKDDSYTWDESYTMPENLFLAYKCGAGEKYGPWACSIWMTSTTIHWRRGAAIWRGATPTAT